jgi:hypothetical protein
VKAVRTIEITQAVPLDGRGRRTRQTELTISERNRYLREAAQFFPGLSHRETAHRVHTAIATYQSGRWRRDCTEATCPVQHNGGLVQVMWMLLKVRDATPSMEAIRKLLAR